MSPSHDESRMHRLRGRIRQLRARAQGTFGAARLVLTALLGRLDEIWIGDSHAVHVNSATMITALRRLPDGRWVWHLGPRIMYSIASEGLPPAVLRVLQLISRTRRAREIVWVFSFGEIDVRCHLVPRMGRPDAALAFVPRYLEQIRHATVLAGADRAFVLVPPPESDSYPDQAGFPVVGTLAERVAASHALRDAMVEAASALPDGPPSITLVDVTDEFSDERGAIIEDYTYDGLHTNDSGRAIIRAKLDSLLDATASH